MTVLSAGAASAGAVSAGKVITSGLLSFRFAHSLECRRRRLRCEVHLGLQRGSGLGRDRRPHERVRWVVLGPELLVQAVGLAGPDVDERALCIDALAFKSDV